MEVLFMKKLNSNSLAIIFKHKEYFDQKLIDSAEYYFAQFMKLKDESFVLTISNREYARTCNSLQLKIDDRDTVIHNLKLNMAKREKEQEDLFQKQLEDLERESKLMRGFLEKLNEHYLEAEQELKEKDEKIKELEKKNKEQEKKNKKLEKAIDKLKCKAQINSSNSSLPPSTDIFQSVIKTREKSTRKVGGQKSHPGHFSKLNEASTKVIEKTVRKAPTGAKPVFNNENVLLYYRTQEIDLVLQTTITETRYYIEETAEDLPKNELNTYAINPVTYSSHLKSLVLYLATKGTIAVDRLCSMLEEMTQHMIKLRPSTIINWMNEFYQKSKPALETILTSILDSKTVGVDETGWKVNGKKVWMQALITKMSAYFVVTQRRGLDPNGPIAILENFKGILIHDHFMAYYKIACIHAECGAHVGRYLKGGLEFEKDENCRDMRNLLFEILQIKRKAIESNLHRISDEEYEAFKKRFLAICEKAISEYNAKHPNIKRKYVPRHIKTFERMEKETEPYLLFIRDFDVPFTNNDVERMQRGVKAKLKISGQSKTLDTANHFAVLHSITKTCLLRNMNTLKAFEDTLNGKDVFFFTASIAE